ncbi:hypothetical protein ACFL48_00230 [Pseudomonadota bacterium]
MQFISRIRSRQSVTFTAIFALQLFAASFCISSATQAAETVATNHCHASVDSASSGHTGMQHSPESTCSHCAAPDDFSFSINDLNQAPGMQLLAYIEFKAVYSEPESAAFNTERAQAPPNSSKTLYTTTQRIRI